MSRSRLGKLATLLLTGLLAGVVVAAVALPALCSARPPWSAWRTRTCPAI